jgi:ABC-type polysaccharide/polyol phosphate export permease
MGASLRGDAETGVAGRGAGEPAVRVIRPVRRRLTLAHLARDRAVIRVLAARDFKVKYKQSLLGPVWLVFQPVALLAAFLVAFRGLAGVRLGVPYVPFAVVGLSVWAFFQASMTMGAASVVSNVQLVRLTPCPRLAFPAAAMMASLPAYGVTILGALLAAAVSGSLSPRALLLPLGLLWLVLLTAGCVAAASSVSVRYRDVLAAMPFLLQVGLFLAPVGYPLAGLSPVLGTLVGLNPLTGVMEAWRWMTLQGYDPSLESIAVSLALTPLVALGGWLFFTRREVTMADEI